jgi:hypothetical protein
MKRVFMDGDNEVVEVVLRMQKRNFDALVKAEEDGLTIPIGGGISIAFDESEAKPVARLLVKGNDSVREEQERMGFYAVSSRAVES